jgi:hypothetical protein
MELLVPALVDLGRHEQFCFSKGDGQCQRPLVSYLQKLSKVLLFVGILYLVNKHSQIPQSHLAA